MDAPSSISSNPKIVLFNEVLPIQHLDVWAGYRRKQASHRQGIYLLMALVLGALLAVLVGDLILPTSRKPLPEPSVNFSHTPAITTVELNPRNDLMHEGKRN